MKYICCNCKKEKNQKEFCINRAESRGRDYFCKDCKKEKKLTYSHTEQGLIQTIWDSQKLSCKLRGHDQPKYSKQELSNWILNHPLFDFLFQKWKESGYLKQFKPSIDRLNDFKTYSFDNICLTTFKENEIKGHKDRHLGKGTQGSLCKPVCQYDLDGNFIQEYPSATLASLNVINTSRQNIQKVCKGLRQTCGGFLWKYKS